MKKAMLLATVMLAMSSTAWGICRVNMSVVNLCCAEDKFFMAGSICCAGQCEVEGYTVSQFCNQLYVDLYLTCSCLDGCSCLSPDELELVAPQGLCCGMYTVAVRVWCSYDCWPYCMLRQPIFCGMGITSFTACCDDCDCYPCRCWALP